MNPDDIKQALIAACKTTATGRGLTVALPNLPSSGATALPRIEIGFESTGAENETTVGGAPLVLTGIFIPTICTKLGILSTIADDHAQAIAALFPTSRKISFTGGVISFRAAPWVRTGYPTETSWRVPISIRYRADAV